MKVMEDVGGVVRTDGSGHEANYFLDGHVVAGAKGLRPLMGHVMKNLNYVAAVAAVVACLLLVPLVSLVFGSVTTGIAYCKLKGTLVFLMLDDVKRPNQGCCSTRLILLMVGSLL